MSVLDRLLSGEKVEVADLRVAVFRAVFGDRAGLTLALVTFFWVGLTWRLGFASNDQYTFANTVLAVADGQLHITQPRYGPSSGATPGTYVVGDQVYGRNYGIVLPSTILYVVFRLIALIADVRILLTGLWSLTLVGIGGALGGRFDKPREGVVAGSLLAGLLFLLSLVVAEPLSSRWLPLIALQLTTAAATAITVVVSYRLVTRCYDRRLGVAAGVAVVVATPIGFWATLPKRHSVTAMLVICAMYTLYRSRAAATPTSARRFRSLTYAWPALLAWVHAPHGVVDLPTARSNTRFDLLSVGAAFGLAFVPFLVTNTLISGNPVLPPRFLPDYSGDILSASAETAGGSSGTASGSGQAGGDVAGSGSDSPSGIWSVFSVFLDGNLAIVRILSQFVSSYAALTEPERLFRVFVHTGYLPTLRPSEDAAINLSVLASMPLLGALVAYPVLAGRRLIERERSLRSPRQWSPIRVVDAFSAVYVVLLLGLYFSSLPLHHMLTVRYLHTLYLIGIVWLVRLPLVRQSVANALRPLTTSYGSTVIVLVPAFLSAIVVGRLVLDESIQLYALFALLVATGAGLSGIVRSLTDGHRKTGSIALGVAAGVASVYLLLAGLALFPTTGEFLLPVARIVSERIHYARLIGSTPPFWDATQLFFVW